jgi:hypothetical protein
MRIRMLALLVAFLLPLPLLADTTYTYTGNDFTSVYGTAYTTSDSVSGSFTVSTPLGGDLLDDNITPASFGFTDGVDTLTNANVTGEEFFSISTNASGEITNWYIVVSDSIVGPAIYTQDDLDGVAADTGENYGLTGVGQNRDDPGTWTETSSSVAPEPSTLALLGTGVLGLAGIVRRRFLHS